MITTILTFLGGIKTWLILGAVAFVVGYGAYLKLDNMRLESQRNEARTQLASAKLFIKGMIEDNDRAARIIADRNADIARLKEKTDNVIAELRRMPSTNQCASSPAIRLVLERMRAEREAAGNTGPRPAR